MIRRKQKRDALSSKNIVDPSGAKESSFNVAPVLGVKRKPMAVGALSRRGELDGDDLDM